MTIELEDTMKTNRHRVAKPRTPSLQPALGFSLRLEVMR